MKCTVSSLSGPSVAVFLLPVFFSLFTVNNYVKGRAGIWVRPRGCSGLLCGGRGREGCPAGVGRRTPRVPLSGWLGSSPHHDSARRVQPSSAKAHRFLVLIKELHSGADSLCAHFITVSAKTSPFCHFWSSSLRKFLWCIDDSRVYAHLCKRTYAIYLSCTHTHHVCLNISLDILWTIIPRKEGVTL